MPGYAGFYDASSHGRIKSLYRTTVRGGVTVQVFERILKPVRIDTGYHYVTLYRDGTKRRFKLHHLIAEVFHGPRPEGAVVRHLDDDKDNNIASNLTYGTRSENAKDAVRNGLNKNANKTHCDHGHEFTKGNTMPNSGGKNRRCKACVDDYNARARQ